MSVLSGLRVVEVSSVGAAAMAAKHLADWGADVTILEPPGGTPLRKAPPYFEVNGSRRSGTWGWLSRGKRSVRVGDGCGASRDQALEFCANADVCLIEGDLCSEVLGVGVDELKAALAGRTTCVLIQPFALDGPYAQYHATDLGLCAMGGWMLGSADREPIKPGADVVWRAAGAWAYDAALIGLRSIRHGARPHFFELSMQAVAASMITAQWIMSGSAPMAQARRGNAFPAGIMRCKDGLVGVSPLTPTHHEMLLRMLGWEDVIEAGGLDPEYRAEHADELGQRAAPWFEARTRAEIMETAQTFRLPAAPVQNVAERLECPQLNARGFFVKAEIEGREVRVPRVPYLISGLEPCQRAELQEVDSLPALPAVSDPPAGGRARQPFDGIRVLDLTWFWSGPSATKLLGALGADVIKVESIQRPDTFRVTSASMDKQKWWETGPLWNDTNNNKRGLTLDLSNPEGKSIFERLVPLADVVISNYSNRVMPQLGLTNDRLRELNPRVIAVTMPGYGPDGPWGNYVGYGVSFEQLAACASMTGYDDGTPTIMGGFSDPLVGLHTVAAIELALKQREETGQGASIEVPQCETLDSTWAPEQIAVQHGAPVPRMQANKHPWMAPHNAYRAGDGDDWLTIAVTADVEFRALVTALGRPGLADDPRFSTTSSRKENEAALDGEIGALIAGQEGRALERVLQAAGVKACRVVRGAALPSDDGLNHLGFFQILSHPVMGDIQHRTVPFRVSDIDARHKRRAPLLGEHSDEILSSLLMLPESELARLRETGVTGTVPLGFGG
jgi:crotonobetainyl-CoA:carnitine CoA-transferase CaiB-like acyl-CoA transferase